MTAQPKSTIKSYFETGDKPTQSQFADLVDSYQDFTALLNNFVSAATFKSGVANITSPSTVTMVSAGVVGLQLLAVQTTAQATSIIGGGDMLKATYDPANIDQQIVGTTAVQTITNKTFVSPTIGAALATSINFGGTSLSKYAEGTFTPVLNFNGASVGITYSTQTGTYTRIGNRVFFEISIVLTSKGSSTGSTFIAGLPFTTAAEDSFSVSSYSNMVSVTTGGILAHAASGATVVDLFQPGSSSIGGLSNASFSDNSTLTLSGQYKAV